MCPWYIILLDKHIHWFQEFLIVGLNNFVVGHCHPHVVNAGQMQMNKIWTSCGFVSDVYTKYVRNLLNVLPESLSVVYLVNSGYVTMYMFYSFLVDKLLYDIISQLLWNLDLNLGLKQMIWLWGWPDSTPRGKI